jgi:hypothetical protein
VLPFRSAVKIYAKSDGTINTQQIEIFSKIKVNKKSPKLILNEYV